MNILDEIKRSYKNGDVLIKIIFVNIGVFLAVNILRVISHLFQVHFFELTEWLAVPADFWNLLFKPWTVFTYMFLHEGLWHILFNMLWLFWFGKIFLEYLTEKQILNVYLLGGLAGAGLYVLAYNAFPAFELSKEVSFALGASASVLAVVVAIAVYVPDYTINLILLGPVKIKYIAVISVVLDVIGIGNTNTGGHIAHLGGALLGYWFARQFRNNKDITKGFGSFMDNIMVAFKPKTKLKVSHRSARNLSDQEYNKTKKVDQKVIDAILDKISKSGYDSLTKKEKETLFRVSKKD